MFEKISEGDVVVKVLKEKRIFRKMPVFYNPVMKMNRSISVLVLKAIGKSVKVGLPLAGSGVRGIRFLKELDNVKSVFFNDLNKDAVKIIKDNLKLNKVDGVVSNEDANRFLLDSSGFDYIDIDPFGSPNPFLDSAVKRISRDGVLAVTATDCSALCGAHKKACLRKYWAVPLHNEIMHEVGLRILIRKVQLIGAQYDKAFVPVFSYSKDHYMRVFFRVEKGKEKVDGLLKKIGCYMDSGPMWLGNLFDKGLVNKMLKLNKDKGLIKFLEIVSEESKIDVVGFYDIHKLVKKNKIKKVPKQIKLIKALKKKKYKASKTHFDDKGIRTDCSEKELVRVVKGLNK